jgi:hypothetical protein
MSYRSGEPVLLQISSYIRDVGEQTEAKQRLLDRVAKSSASWIIWGHRLIRPFARRWKALLLFLSKSRIIVIEIEV